jgi:hypothetical protein
MNKTFSTKFGRTTVSIITALVLAFALFVFTSCKSDYGKALDGGTETIANVPATSADDTGTNQTDAASTSGSETGAAASAETTAQPANQKAKQIIEVVASGGYSPRKIDAKAGVPTILIMKSEGAYGCERAFNIPDLNISEMLPENGQTQFDLGTPAAGTKLLGVCSMGMYSFQIFFN